MGFLTLLLLRRITDEDISRRLDALRRDSETGMLDTTQIGPIDYLISEEDKEKEIPNDKELIEAFKDEIEKKEREKIAEERRFYRTKKSEEIKEREEELKQKNEKDQEIINDENAFPQDKEAAGARVAQRNKELARFQTQIAEREAVMPLRERVREIFKKNGVTVAAIFLAAGATIGAVIGAMTNSLKALGKDLGNGLKTLGAKAASVLPGLIGSLTRCLKNQCHYTHRANNYSGFIYFMLRRFFRVFPHSVFFRNCFMTFFQSWPQCLRGHGGFMNWV